jgi:hypothetical protein
MDALYYGLGEAQMKITPRGRRTRACDKVTLRWNKRRETRRSPSTTLSMALAGGYDFFGQRFSVLHLNLYSALCILHSSLKCIADD